MAPTLPILTPFAFSDDQLIILSDDDDTAFSNEQLIALSDDDQVPDESSEDEEEPCNVWGHDDNIRLVDTIAKLRRENRGIMPSASAVLAALDRSQLQHGGELDVPTISQKMYRLKNKLKVTLAIANGEQRPGRKWRTKRAWREKKLLEHSKEAWPELVAASDERRRQARRARTAVGGSRVQFN